MEHKHALYVKMENSKIQKVKHIAISVCQVSLAYKEAQHVKPVLLEVTRLYQAPLHAFHVQLEKSRPTLVLVYVVIATQAPTPISMHHPYVYPVLKDHMHH
jgi:hypothetical protein